MISSKAWKIFGTAAVCSAVLFGSTIAVSQDKPDAGDKAIEARKGYMKVVGWEAGPLFGMAKGEVPYDAASASAHAANLQSIAGYPVGSLFLPDTAKSDRPGKTRH